MLLLSPGPASTSPPRPWARPLAPWAPLCTVRAGTGARGPPRTLAPSHEARVHEVLARQPQVGAAARWRVWPC